MSAPTTPEARAARGASEEGSPGALRTPRASQLAGDEQSPASTKDYGECANFGAPPTLEGTAEEGAEQEGETNEETSQQNAGTWSEVVRRRAGKQHRTHNKNPVSLAESLRQAAELLEFWNRNHTVCFYTF